MDAANLCSCCGVNSMITERTSALTCTPTRMHPFSAEVTFSAKSFEDYTCTFMWGEVIIKEFHKARYPKTDFFKNNLLLHWFEVVKMYVDPFTNLCRGFQSMASDGSGYTCIRP